MVHPFEQVLEVVEPALARSRPFRFVQLASGAKAPGFSAIVRLAAFVAVARITLQARYQHFANVYAAIIIIGFIGLGTDMSWR